MCIRDRGDVKSLGGGGVARHRAVLFKLLGDTAGLDVALARGARNESLKSSAHVWNELWVGNRCYVVDLTSPSMGFEFLETAKDSVQAYRTAAGSVFYRKPGEN